MRIGDEIREEKKKLQERIAQMINEFQEKYGVIVEEIKVGGTWVIGDGDVVLVEIKVVV